MKIGIVPCAGCTEDSDCAVCSCASCGQRGNTCPGPERCSKVAKAAKPLKVLIGCEKSQEICIAFRELGHEAFSCDLEPCTGGHPEWHIIEDVRNYFHGNNWQVFIVHPPCRDIAASGARYFAEKRKDGSQAQAVKFFMEMVNAPIPRVCVENSVGVMSRLYRKPDQYIQPYQFGHDASKNTCLWLRGLPKLEIDPSDYIKPRIVNGRPRWANQTDSGQNKLSPSEHRADDRAKTYSGIARAMALQWGGNSNVS